jgi:hypothetical protein
VSDPRAKSDDVWIADEPRLTEVTARMFRRARHRPFHVLALAIAVTALAVGYRASKAPKYQGTLYFRLAEGDVVSPDHQPEPPSDVQQYISSVALSRTQLEEIMRRHGVSRRWLDRDPAAAVSSFRQDIEISVTRNFFLYDREAGDPPRSASVALSITLDDPDTVQSVLHEFRDAIQADQQRRVGQLQQVAQIFRAQLGEAQERARAVQAELRRTSAQLGIRDPHQLALQPRIATLRLELNTAQDRIATLERALVAAAFTGDAEQNLLGLRLDLMDERVRTHSKKLTPAALLVRTVLTLLLATAFAAVAVGAFDDRIYDGRDVAACRLPVLGAFSRFPGDDRGSFRERNAAEPSSP